MTTVKWTPQQAGRFHLRNRRIHESIESYCARIFPSSTPKQLERHAQDVVKELQVAIKERERRNKAGMYNPRGHSGHGLAT